MPTLSLFLSMALMAIGNGLMFAFIPVSLGASGFDPAWSGAVLTSLSAGGLVGCLMTGRLVAQVGHARSFMICAALIVLSHAAISFGLMPIVWLVSRGVYGFAITALFVIVQSWLNDIVRNEIRGRVISTFYITYLVASGLGSLLLTFVDVGRNTGPTIALFFAGLAILPIGLTTLKLPPPPERTSIAIRKAWQISPVGLAGMFTVGGLSMIVVGFSPIHFIAAGLSQEKIALLMLMMQVGTIFIQLPLGWASDRTDRRFVIILAAGMVTCASIFAGLTRDVSFIWFALIFIVLSGSTESIYSLSSAHANDRADRTDLVLLSSTMMFAWSLSGFIFPALVTFLTASFGTRAFMIIAAVLSFVFGVFVVLRVLARTRVVEQTVAVTPMAALAPAATDVAFGVDGARD